MKSLVFSLFLVSGLAQATPISDALTACLLGSQTVVKSLAIQHPKVNKIGVDGKDDVVFGLSCGGKLAETLYYESAKLGGYDQGHSGYGYFERQWSDGTLVRTIYLGVGMNNGHRSACHQRVQDSSGQPMSYIWCHLLIDLKRDLLANLDLNDMIKIEIKPEVKKEDPKAPEKLKQLKVKVPPKP